MITTLKIVTHAGVPVVPITWIAPCGDRYEVIGPDLYRAADGSEYTQAAMYARYSRGAAFLASEASLWRCWP